MPVYGACIRIYHVLCIKKSGTFGGLLWSPAGSRQAARGPAFVKLAYWIVFKQNVPAILNSFPLYCMVEFCHYLLLLICCKVSNESFRKFDFVLPIRNVHGIRFIRYDNIVPLNGMMALILSIFVQCTVRCSHKYTRARMRIIMGSLLTRLVPKPQYPGRTKSIPWLLIVNCYTHYLKNK